MADHEVTTREEWLAARTELLESEKELTRRSDELARKRRELPWVRIEKEYRFETDDGSQTLADLFDGRSQLLVYHFMFDGVLVHLENHDVTFLAVSRAPLEELQAYKRRMGWKFPWASSHGSDFNSDYGVSFTREGLRDGIEYNYRAIPGEAFAQLLEAEVGPIAQLAVACGTDPAGYMTEGPGLSAFALSDGVVYHTYSSYARGAEFLMDYYGLLDRAPEGRNEGDPPEPWVRRHDEYERPTPKEANR
jgi:predicted dithiol-disulfide oxidoreductase (DUF899 family)